MSDATKWFYAACLSAVPPVFGFPIPVASSVFLAAACVIGCLIAINKEGRKDDVPAAD